MNSSWPSVRIDAGPRPSRAYAQRLATILVHAGASAESEALVHAAAEVANLFGAKLIGVSTLPYSTPSMSEAEDEAMRLLLENGARRFDAISSIVHAGACWRTHGGPASAALRAFAWAADLITVNTHSPGGGDERCATLQALVTQGRRPVLVRPRGSTFRPFKRVIVVWDASPACARAVTSALPFLGRAEQVVVVAEKAHPTDRHRRSLQCLKEGLALRGIPISIPSERDIERHPELLLTVRDIEADLVVMSAWRRPTVLSFLDQTEKFIAELNSFVLLSH